MDELAPAANDPDSSLPSLFPYDSFPIPRGLYTNSDSSRNSVAKYDQVEDGNERLQGEPGLSTPRGKVLVGNDLLETLKRPRAAAIGLAPALPVSPPRSSGSSKSPATSPSRSRRANAAELRSLAQKNRARDTQVDDFASHLTSRSTLASFTSTGESVYEDAIEPDSDANEEILLDADLSDPMVLPPLDASNLPDTPPELEVPEREPRNREITPRPNPPPLSASVSLEGPAPLTPETVASLDERTLYEQRQAELRAEAKQRGSARLSISSLPTSPRGGVPSSFRRHSGFLPSTPGSTSHYRRLSLSSATSPPISGSRQWHPKPLVLTPARTLSTPLTGDSNHPPSPPRHLSAQEASLEGYPRTHSRGSSYHDGTIRSVSPLSPGRHTIAGRATSPFQSSPRRQSSLGGNVKRRSLGYVDSAALTSLGQTPFGYDRRRRSASQDTGTTRTTINSTLTRFTPEGESPESSLGGWSDGRQPSPLLNDKEWEQQWQVNGAGGTPLEMVAEVSSGDIKPIDFADETEAGSQQKRISSTAPIVRRRAATDDRRSIASAGSRSGSLTESSFAPVRPLSIRRDSVPPTPPPRLPLPRTPSSRPNSMSLPAKRARQKYNERWSGEPLEQDPESSSSSVGDEYSDVPVSPKKPALSSANSGTPTSPRRPIVIKGTNSQSAAALARRSARLSLADPPLYPASANSSRNSLYSSEQYADSRPSSRGSRHTTGRSSRETSQDVRLGAGGPLSTLPESPVNHSDGFSPQLPYAARAERPSSRASYSSQRISIGSTFANGFGATRKVDFEPRDPRTREELDAGQGSYLEVLLYSDPPPRPKRASTRWSTTTASTTAMSSVRDKKEAMIGTPLVRSDTPPSKVAATKPKYSSNFAQKFFGGLRGKPVQPTDKASAPTKRRPMSLIAQSPARPESKPRPIVSGPLELQQAEREQAQKARDAAAARGATPPSGSVSFAPPITVMKSYASLARVYEEDSSSDRSPDRPLNRSASLETVDRPAPRPFSLPPGLLVNSQSSDSLRPPPPVTPIKPPRSPLRPTRNSGNEPAVDATGSLTTTTKTAARAGSPVLSHKSFQSQWQPSIGSNAAKSFVSTTSASEPIGVRDVLRGQFLER